VRITSPDSLHALSVTDVMLATPKTLPSRATVAQVRDALANPHTEMVLLVDGPVFRGAVVAIPDDADAGSPALDHVEPSPELIAPTEAAGAAFSRARANPQRRAVVLDEDGNLLGLVCLNRTLTWFCTGRTAASS
jgi:hypothetical protein